jgi:hypothetical protein
MENEKIKDFIGKGAEIAGGAVGGAIGLIGGPVFAILGGTLGAAFVVGIKEVINRQLSNRQEMRVAASTAYILTDVKEKLDHGYQVRTDSFFDATNGRSTAEELFEGILLKCKDQYQEKKIYYISKIFEKAAFDSSFSAETANQILSTAESFTYRKLCIIGYFGRKTEFDSSLLMKEPYSWYENAIFPIPLELLKQDIFDLVNLGIVDQANMMLGSRHDIIPAEFSLTPLGNEYFSAMELSSIPKNDLEPIYDELKYRDIFGLNDKGTKNVGIPN